MTPFRKISKNHRLGFIGLGRLGSPMARRLLAAGFPMVVYNRGIDKTNAFAALGVEVARDPGELAAEVDVVLSCVSDDMAVEEVYLGARGVLRNAKPDTLVIEMSTISPETSRKIYRIESAAGREEDFSAVVLWMERLAAESSLPPAA